MRGKRGLNHVHVGSLHAADAEMALRAARDVYTRRNEGVSIWVVRAADITASSPDEKDPMFAPSGDKVYRHPTFYESPTTSPTCERPGKTRPTQAEHPTNAHTTVTPRSTTPTRDGQWAFGTGFDDPLAGVDTTVPDGVDPADLAAYCLMLGDDALVLPSGSPSGDPRAGARGGGGAGEHRARPARADPAALRPCGAAATRPLAPPPAGAGAGRGPLAFFRDPDDFRCVRLAALPTATSPARSSGCSSLATWRLALFARLRESRDPVLAAVAAKGVKEVAYHRDHAGRWLLRLGDGTAESHRRAQDGVDEVWPLRRSCSPPRTSRPG